MYVYEILDHDGETICDGYDLKEVVASAEDYLAHKMAGDGEYGFTEDTFTLTFVDDETLEYGETEVTLSWGVSKPSDDICFDLYVAQGRV